MSLWLPKGSLASTDTYTRRYDEIVDDTPLYDKNIENAFLMCVII